MSRDGTQEGRPGSRPGRRLCGCMTLREQSCQLHRAARVGEQLGAKISLHDCFLGAAAGVVGGTRATNAKAIRQKCKLTLEYS